MKIKNRMICALALASAVFTGQATATNWQNQLSGAASELSKNGSLSGTQSGALSVSSLTGLLNGGNKALSSNSMNNVVGMIEYCAKNKLTSTTSVDDVKSQLISKLGLGDTPKPAEKQDYSQGLMGLLNTGDGQQLNLNTIGNSPLAQKVKTKACDLVLKQGINYLS